MSGHVISQLLDGLLDTMRAGVGQDPIRIDDGIPISDVEMPDSIAIGSAVDEVAPVTSQPTLLLASSLVGHDITCAVQSWTGDVHATALSERRARAFEVLTVALNALRDRPDLGLGDLITDMSVTSTSYRPVVAEPSDDTVQGCLALVEFVIHIDTYETE